MFRAILQAHCLTLKAAGERGAGLAPQSRDCSPAGGLLSRSSILYGKVVCGTYPGKITIGFQNPSPNPNRSKLRWLSTLPGRVLGGRKGREGVHCDPLSGTSVRGREQPLAGEILAELHKGDKLPRKPMRVRVKP